MLDLCIRDDKPLLGICRGIQFINAHLGGTLYQDLPSEYVSDIEHHMLPPYEKAAHKVNVEVGTKLASIIGSGTHEVNSYHHQAIKEMAPRVIKIAASEDGLVEAIEIKDQRFAVAVQWHPEFSYKVCEDSMKLVQAFVDACHISK
jgi:putative glutamine amidotransferase